MTNDDVAFINANAQPMRGRQQEDFGRSEDEPVQEVDGFWIAQNR